MLLSVIRKVGKYGTGGQPIYNCTSITGRMSFARWTAKATDTYLEHVIFIAFPQQQWLRERTSVLLVFLYCLSGISCTCHCKW
jgi:hypothetical protein